MNTKGFTLVELLAVIVILALLALLTSTAVTKLVKDAKDDLSETQMQLIKSAADTWMADNLNKLPSAGSCGYLTLKDLKNYGLLNNTILDPKNSEEISDDLKIKITTATSAYGNPTSTAEVNPESIEGCEAIYSPSCYAIEGDGSNVGDKIACDIGDTPENFYVISNDGTSIEMLTEKAINTTGTGDIKQIDSAEFIAFVSTETSIYWTDTGNTSGNLKLAYGSSYPAYVYDENSLIYPYITSYANYLTTAGIDIIDAKLISLESFEQLESIIKEEWMYVPGTYFGSAFDSRFVYYSCGYEIVCARDWSPSYAWESGSEFRPVITIPIFELQ